MDYVCEGPISYIGHGAAERPGGPPAQQAGPRPHRTGLCRSIRWTRTQQGRRRELRRPADRDREGQSGAARQRPGGRRARWRGRALTGNRKNCCADARQKLGSRMPVCRVTRPVRPPPSSAEASRRSSRSACGDGYDAAGAVALAAAASQGCWVGAKLVVMPGAHFIERKGMSRHNLDRRAFAQRRRARSNIRRCRSLPPARGARLRHAAAIAAKVLVGMHVGSKVWVPASAPAPRLAAGAGHG